MRTRFGFVLEEPDPNKPLINWIAYKDMDPTMNCPTCHTALPADHAAFNLPKLQDWIKKQGGWGIFENVRYKVGSTFSIPGVSNVVEIAALKTSYDSGDIDVEGYYGESALPQGSEFETYVVLRVGDSYFKKTGTGDSYGKISWDGDVRAVTPKVKTIEVFD